MGEPRSLGLVGRGSRGRVVRGGAVASKLPLKGSLWRMVSRQKAVGAEAACAAVLVVRTVKMVVLGIYWEMG